MSDLPESWAWATLENLAASTPRSMTDGPFGSNLKTAHYTDAGPRVIRLQNIGDGVFNDVEAHISPEHFESLTSHSVVAGDLVVASLGTDLPRACLVPASVPPAIVKADCIRVRLHAEIDAKYVNFALQRPELRRKTQDEIHGVGRPRIGMTGVKAFTVPVPPLPEQRRIVAAIEEHFSRLEAAEAQLTAAYKRSQVCEGLTIASLLSGIETQSALKDALAHFSDCPHRTPKYSDDGEYVALRPRDVVDGVLRIESAARVDQTEFDTQSERRRLDRGDVVYSRELSYGWAAVIPAPDRVCLSQGMVAMVPGDDLLPEFLTLVLNSPIGRRQSERAATGSAHPHVNLRDIRQFQIPMPSLAEQHEIVAQAAAARSALQRLRDDVGTGSKRSSVLRRSILTAAFSGRLVPQDPSDGPASALLERIATERAESKPSRRKKAAS